MTWQELINILPKGDIILEFSHSNFKIVKTADGTYLPILLNGYQRKGDNNDIQRGMERDII